MKTIEIGNSFRIYDDSLLIHDLLPAQTYRVQFEEMSGFSLVLHKDMEIKEKVYGVHDSKLHKVMNAFQNFDRSLGVILSGEKGIGKSLFAKMLCKEAVTEGYPVIIVDSSIPGLSAYLESIEQEVVVLFDEFDKVFGSCGTRNGFPNPQTELLSLFDGTAGGKKLYVITCNDIDGLNEFLVNRPGRFHYHFRFEYPTSEEITVYLQDKLTPEYYGEINSVVSFALRVPLNYDCLRAIAFELNTGLPFKVAIKDLNILNTETKFYQATLYYKDGDFVRKNKADIDFFDPESAQRILMRDSSGRDIVLVSFELASCTIDQTTGAIFVPAKAIRATYDYYELDVTEGKNPYRNRPIDHLIITRIPEPSLHYSL